MKRRDRESNFTALLQMKPSMIELNLSPPTTLENHVRHTTTGKHTNWPVYLRCSPTSMVTNKSWGNEECATKVRRLTQITHSANKTYTTPLNLAVAPNSPKQVLFIDFGPQRRCVCICLYKQIHNIQIHISIYLCKERCILLLSIHPRVYIHIHVYVYVCSLYPRGSKALNNEYLAQTIVINPYIES